MDAYKTLTSLRAVRHFTDQALSQETLTRILQAGRWTGSAKNVQPWHFIVIRQRETLEQLAGCGRFASHLRGAAAAIVIVTEAHLWAGFECDSFARNRLKDRGMSGKMKILTTDYPMLGAIPNPK